VKRSNRLAIWIAVTLVIIVGILVSPWISGPPQDLAHRNYCEALISSLEQGLALYESDQGNYPPSLATLSETRSARGSVYFEFKASQKDGQGRILDPWSHPFIYRVRRDEKGRNRVLLYSTGPNGIDENGKGDDVKND
jgi:type II secretion system (T2SS) protein G